MEAPADSGGSPTDDLAFSRRKIQSLTREREQSLREMGRADGYRVGHRGTDRGCDSEERSKEGQPSCGRFKNCGELNRLMGFPRGSDSKESACNAGDPDTGPGSGRSPPPHPTPAEGNGNSLQ